MHCSCSNCIGSRLLRWLSRISCAREVHFDPQWTPRAAEALTSSRVLRLASASPPKARLHQTKQCPTGSDTAPRATGVYLLNINRSRSFLTSRRIVCLIIYPTCASSCSPASPPSTNLTIATASGTRKGPHCSQASREPFRVLDLSLARALTAFLSYDLYCQHEHIA